MSPVRTLNGGKPFAAALSGFDRSAMHNAARECHMHRTINSQNREPIRMV